MSRSSRGGWASPHDATPARSGGVSSSRISRHHDDVEWLLLKGWSWANTTTPGGCNCLEQIEIAHLPDRSERESDRVLRSWPVDAAAAAGVLTNRDLRDNVRCVSELGHPRPRPSAIRREDINIRLSVCRCSLPLGALGSD